MKKVTWKELEKQNIEGKVFLLPTDTIYGFSCGSFDYSARKK